MISIILSLIIIALIILCAVFGIKLANAKAEAAVSIERINLLETQLSDARAQLAIAVNNEKKAADQFELIANRALSQSANILKEQNEVRLREILAPLRENINSFSKSVSDAYNNEARERFSLQERLRELISLNQTISRQAQDLTDALRGNSKVQGDWGEMILETLLEKSGLKRGIHFSVQQTRDDSGKVLSDETGSRLRPDVVINYPDGRYMVVDSKTSLTAYVNMVNADSPDEAKRQGSLHIASIKAHIKELATKSYQDYLGSSTADFVMMFIPNEGAYLAALNLEPQLWQQAYDSRVIIVSPTHLMSALKLVEQLWQQSDIKRNALEIATEAGKMHDKFVTFIDDLQKIERAIDQTRSAYDAAFNKLSSGKGNLVKRAADLKTLGAKAQKNLPDSLIDKSRSLSQPE